MRPRPRREDASGTPDPAEVARRLERWIDRPGIARDLPWRTGRAGERDAYLALVSETMLQQTQVSRVRERYPRFIERFPTIQALAAADEHDVLAEWSGMGYYRRARNLHAAAKLIVAEHGGRVPQTAAALARLPGIGRYTAGAIASIAFGEPAPIVDGNVARVLLRIHGRPGASDDQRIGRWLWEQAGALSAAAERPGVLNESLMELGATVCVPAPSAPRCDRCPVSGVCAARAAGTQLEIPRPRVRSRQRRLYCGSVVVRREDGCVLVEQRGPMGMWAGLWQAPTVESMDAAVTAAEAARLVGLPARRLRPESSFEHQTTHRRVEFRVWRAEADTRFVPPRGVWMTAGRIERLGLSRPQRRILLEGVAGGTLWS